MSSAATAELLVTYHELNGDIEELPEPSPLSFMRFVARNRPFVVRGGCSTWQAQRKWDATYLQEIMKDTPVNVAVTPHGNADSAAINPKDGHKYFVKPLETKEPFSQFLIYLQNQSLQRAGSVIKYSQTQNDNLRGEYLKLYEDVDPNIRWASIALQRKPDAINLWIGNSHSVTALHRDNYENIFCQILGAKGFVLLPPVETACINEQFLPTATYDETMDLIPDDPPTQVPCAIWDPDKPIENTTKFSHLSRPLRVRLDPGDMLYLPSCWYHKVSQRNSKEGVCCSVNYWYDMDFDGTFHASNSFVRNMAWAVAEQNEPDKTDQLMP